VRAITRICLVIGSLIVPLFLAMGPSVAQSDSVASTSATSGSNARIAGRIPSKKRWLRDVHKALHKAHARHYASVRAQSGEAKLAINFDIDNTVIASHFGGGAIPEMLRFTRFAHRLGYAILFNTGRNESARAKTLAELRRNHFRVDGLCMRQTGERLVPSKKRCRREYIQQGFTLVENVGNSPSDMQGRGYERRVRLPNYGGRIL
jgi:hypothetical protein